MDQALKHPWIVYEGQGAPAPTSKKIFSTILLTCLMFHGSRQCTHMCACVSRCPLSDKLRRYTSFPLFKRLSLLVLARMLPDQNMLRQLVCVHLLMLRCVRSHAAMFGDIVCVCVLWLQDWFHHFDKSDVGYITHQDLTTAGKERGLPLLDREVEALIRDVGILRSGIITYHEFVAATLPRTVYLDVCATFLTPQAILCCARLSVCVVLCLPVSRMRML